MKKIALLTAIIMTLFVISSCGVILDENKLIGTWILSEVEFYTYNSALDSYKTYYGIDTTPDSDSPSKGAFFFDSNYNKTYTMKLLDNKQLSIEDNSTTPNIIVAPTAGNWEMSSYNNSLTLKIGAASPATSTYLFWSHGFELTNSWPLIDNEKLEIYIKASELGQSNFKIDLSGSTIFVHAMRGKFTLSN